MSEDPRDPMAGLAEGMEAAGALIESLEGEVESLRGDLEDAYAALKAAQEEVSSRADELETKERARIEAEREAEDLNAEISSLKQRHSNEQLRLSNEHINELAQVRQNLEEQRLSDLDAASSDSRLDAGPLLLLELIGPGGDLPLGRLQCRGRLFEVAPEALHLPFEAFDQGAGSLHAVREPGHRVPGGVLAHDRLSCITLATTMAERLTPGKATVKPHVIRPIRSDRNKRPNKLKC